MREYNAESPKQDSKRFNSQGRRNSLPIWVYNLSMDAGEWGGGGVKGLYTGRRGLRQGIVVEIDLSRTDQK